MEEITDIIWKNIQDSMADLKLPMLNMLKRWANINSYSYHLPGLSTQLKTIESFCQEKLKGAKIEQISLPPSLEVDNKGNQVHQHLGYALKLTLNQNAKTNVLLMGHMDTVFAPSHPFQKAVMTNNDTRLQGPGVSDMKGGIIVMLMALQAFLHTPYRNALNFTVLITPDEEIGSPGSRALIESLAKTHHIGLIYEPSLTLSGTLVSTRPGKGNYTIDVLGKAAHSGRDFAAGRNAICALAQVVTALAELSDPSAGVTVNVGVIAGGEAVNCVPERALCRFEMRYNTPDQQIQLEARINDILASVETTAEVKCRLQGTHSRPPKLATPDFVTLQTWTTQLGKKYGYDITWAPSGGVSDGNNTQACGLPTIDTLGVRGEGIHTDQETVVIESLLERAQLSVLLLLGLVCDPPSFIRNAQ